MKGWGRFTEPEEKSDIVEPLPTMNRLEQIFLRRGERVYAT
jgi:hypothetical protein